MAERQAWREWLDGVDASRLVYLDETGAKTNMTRGYARARKGDRALDYAPHGHWNTTTLVAGITCQSAVAPMVLDGPMDASAFDAYLGQVLIPALPLGSVVVMDNLPAHRTASVAALMQDAGLELRYLPPYSPDFNPIELMWSKVKSHLRSAKARTRDELHDAIADAFGKISPGDAKGFFGHCGVGMIS